MRRPGSPHSNRNEWPPMAPHGVYRALGEDSWIAIACRDDADWNALARVVDRLRERAGTLVERVRHRERECPGGGYRDRRAPGRRGGKLGVCRNRAEPVDTGRRERRQVEDGHAIAIRDRTVNGRRQVAHRAWGRLRRGSQHAQPHRCTRDRRAGPLRDGDFDRAEAHLGRLEVDVGGPALDGVVDHGARGLVAPGGGGAGDARRVLGALAGADAVASGLVVGAVAAGDRQQQTFDAV